MKQVKQTLMRTLFVGATIIFLAVGCKKSGGGPNNQPNNLNPWNDGNVSVSIAGVKWNANSVYAVDSSNIIFIFAGASTTGGTNAFPFLMMAFPDNTKEGATINIDLSKGSLFQFYESQSAVYFADPVIGGSGSVYISKFNKSSKRLEGTFTASVKNTGAAGTTKSLTGGTFAVNYR